MSNNAPSASREWFITINNPIDHGFPHDVIISVITSQKMLYYAISDEIGEKGTYHTHIYGVWINPMRFDSLIKKFNHKANVQPPIENATPEDRRNYIFKEGKYKDSEKNHTNLPDTHVEWGILPEKQQGKRNDLDTLYSLIKDGATDKQFHAWKNKEYQVYNKGDAKFGQENARKQYHHHHKPTT